MFKASANCWTVLLLCLLGLLAHAAGSPVPSSEENPLDEQQVKQRGFTTEVENTTFDSHNANLGHPDDSSDQFLANYFSLDGNSTGEGNWTEFEGEGRSLGKIKDAGQRVWFYLGFEKLYNWLTGKKEQHAIHFPQQPYPAHHSLFNLKPAFKPLKTETKPAVIYSQIGDQRPYYN